MRRDFLLDPEVAYLNHGSYGACPVEVFEEYQEWQRRLEREPTDFFTRRLAGWFSGEETAGGGLLGEARTSLGAFVGARGEDLVFFPNATSALNTVLRSQRLRPGDEVLTTTHEYGAIQRTLEFAGLDVVACEPGEVIDRIGDRTRIVLVSHLTSATALVLPAAEICSAGRVGGRWRSWTTRTRRGRSRSTSSPSGPMCTPATVTRGATMWD